VILLGFDTATRATAVGLRLADGSALQARDDPAAEDHPGHATRLLGMADALLTRAGIGWTALQRIAVGLGPGRFTGLRVGIATARGLAQSLSVELVGVSTLRALAQPALDAGEGAQRVLAVIDALRGEVFAAGYTADPRGHGAVRELAIPEPLRPERLGEVIRRASGGQDARWLAVGDGAVRYRAELLTAGWEVPDDASPLHTVDARAVCQLADRSRAAACYEELVPDYRRRPDAEGVRTADRPGKPATELQGAAG
jgi:tRNA threonylcarbamoyladenosine biosynthesis protein TsaB